MCQYFRPEKLVARLGIESGSPAYAAVALHSELQTAPVSMNEETLIDDPSAKNEGPQKCYKVTGLWIIQLYCINRNNMMTGLDM